MGALKGFLAIVLTAIGVVITPIAQADNTDNGTEFYLVVTHVHHGSALSSLTFPNKKACLSAKANVSRMIEHVDADRHYEARCLKKSDATNANPTTLIQQPLSSKYPTNRDDISRHPSRLILYAKEY